MVIVHHRAAPIARIVSGDTPIVVSIHKIGFEGYGFVEIPDGIGGIGDFEVGVSPVKKDVA